MQRPTAKHWAEVRDSYGKVEGRSEGPRGNRNSIGRPLGLSKTEPPTKKRMWAGPRPPCTYVADVQLGLPMGPEQLEQVPNSCCLFLRYDLLAGLPCLSSVGVDAPSFTES